MRLIKMMKYRITKYYLVIIILMTNLSYSQETSFEKIYPTTGVSSGTDVIETKYGGYLIAGSITPWSTSVLLMNVDGMGNLIWEKHLCFGIARSITYSDANNYILAGRAPNNEDILIVKINSDGDTLWTKNINKLNDEIATKIINTYDGGYAITGWGRDKNLDVYLIKTDENCDTLWTKSFGEYDNDLGYDIRELPDKGFIIAGTTSGGSELNSFSSAYVIRTDSTGDLIWSKRYSIKGNAECRGIIASSEGDYVFAGETSNKESNLSDLFLFKINEQGDSLWIKTYEDSILSRIYSIQQTSDGDFVMSGNGGIFKTDVDGNFLWSKSIDGKGYSIKETTDKGYIVSGVSESNWDILLVKTRMDGFVSVNEEIPIPSEYVLFQNFPNPFNPETTITFENTSPGRFTIEIYDIVGKKIETIYDLHTHVGLHKIKFDGGGLSSGVYFYRISSDKFTKTKKMILLK